jgi:hypothetical protein
MQLTWPQIIMMNHAAWVNGQRYEQTKGKSVSPSAPVMNGKSLDQLNSDELSQYYSDWT